MSAPMLLPLILLGGATIALAAASKKKNYDTPPPGTVRTYTLDTNIPQTVRHGQRRLAGTRGAKEKHTHRVRRLLRDRGKRDASAEVGMIET